MASDEEQTHNELVKFTMKTLNNLVSSDPVLSDLPNDFTLEEVTAQLALQQGKSITIYVVKENNQSMPIVVPLSATVLDLKRAIKRFVCLDLKRNNDLTKISWKYVWKKNWLVFGSDRLNDDNKTLSDCGLSNKAKVYFRKRYREKNKMKQ